jgi:phytoene dehydrogenase-like protein
MYQITERIFEPWKRRIESLGGEIRGQHAVRQLVLSPNTGAVTGVVAERRSEHGGGATEMVTYEADAVVLAVGVGAAQRIVSASPALASKPDFAAVLSLRTVRVRIRSV